VSGREKAQSRGRHGRHYNYNSEIALAEPSRDAVRDRMDHVMVDLLGDFAGKMRGPVGHSLTWKRDCVWGAQERRHCGERENY
jgi:hypothetical protein